MSLKAGTFKAKGMSAELGYTKDNKEQVAVELRVVDEEFLGETITWFGYFTDKTEERTIESLRLLGWTGDEIWDLSSIDGSTEVRIVIEEEEYDGKWRLKVRWINSMGGLGLAKPMNDAQAKAFAARMKGKVLAHDKKTGAAASRPSTNRAQSSVRADEPPPPRDEDAPF